MIQSTTHTALRRTLVFLAATELVIGLGVVGLSHRDAAPPVSVDDAVSIFRAQTREPVPPTSVPQAPEELAAPPRSGGASPPVPRATSAAPPAVTLPEGPPTTEVQTPAPPRPSSAPSRLPDPGVYVYRTSGYEHVDALTGARHDYPEETTISYTPSGCGLVEKWAPLAERADERLLCDGAHGNEVKWFDSRHEFFGQKDNRRLTCQEGALARPLPARQGERWTYECRNDSDRSLTNGTNHGAVPVEVGGNTISSTHIELKISISGSGTATMTVNLWLHPDNGLVLRREAHVQATSSGPSGQINYEERYEIRLIALTPRT